MARSAALLTVFLITAGTTCFYRMVYPYSMEPVEDEDEVKKYFTGELSGFFTVGPKHWFFPHEFRKYAEKYFYFSVRPDDVWIVTFPRSGTTMMQELVWMITHNFDYELGAQKALYERVPFFEYNMYHTEAQHARALASLNGSDEEHRRILSEARKPIYETLNSAYSPRLIKTHIPFSLLPTTLHFSKVIYVARNPRDVAASYYHHNQYLKFFDFKGDFKSYWKFFTKGQVHYGPYWEHIEEGWTRRNEPFVKWIYYENLLKDMRGSIREVAEFLGKSVSDEQVETLATHMEIDNFRKIKIRQDRLMEGLINESQQGFVRKGQTGNATEFDKELWKESEKWIQENQERIGITFPV